MRKEHLATIAVHAGTPSGHNAPVTPPIVQSTTFRFESAAAVQAYATGDSQLFMYSRDGNPTVAAAEEAVAALEGGEACVLFGSGMGAMAAALMTFASAGDEILASAALYGGTYRFLRDVLARFGVKTRFETPERLVDACARSAGTKLCVFESPTNPTLRVLDIAAVAAACRKAGVVSLIDSTFGPPSLQRPLALGVDVVMHSATKYLNGHSDHLVGALVGSRERLTPIRKLSHELGAAVDPQVAFDLLRGLRTFPLRMERHSANALTVARFLEEHAAVQRTWYPGLASHPDHALAVRQMKGGFGGMVTFTLGEKEKAFRFWDRLKLCVRAASLGGTETLCSLPVLFSHHGYSKDELILAGVDEGMVRMSVGLEDVRDLIADLAQALAA